MSLLLKHKKVAQGFKEVNIDKNSCEKITMKSCIIYFQCVSFATKQHLKEFADDNTPL